MKKSVEKYFNDNFVKKKMVVLETAGSMVTIGNTQYLQPDYLSPLPTTVSFIRYFCEKNSKKCTNIFFSLKMSEKNRICEKHKICEKFKIFKVNLLKEFLLNKFFLNKLTKLKIFKFCFNNL